MPYDPSVIEPRWQAYWEEHQTFLTREEPGRPKSYILDMFPYPSGSGLHVGHPEGYTATDIIARQRRMAGFNVLHPMGWDAFGLPAERAAIREGRHPAEITKANTDNFRRQIKRLGFSYDWTREIDTSSPDYYRFTQWIFLRLYEQGLAYRAEVPVNWCPALGTVLANEEVSPEGTYKETGDPVERRLMKQWMLRITAYAERLLEDLEDLDWPDAVKKMQREWIGRSEGAEIQFRIRGTPELSFEVYTTRPDTLFGVTYVVLAPEHPMVSKITSAEHRVAVEDYVQAAGRRKERDRMAEQAKKTGVFTGAHAEHPLTGEALPVWIADYVVATYGTGAIMAVPAHDERDFAFASAFSLPMRQVVAASAEDPIQPLAAAWTQHGISVASGPYDGLPTAECQRRITAELEAKGLGRRRVQYALRDWLFSRQRYWGEPFPLVLRPDGTVVPLPDDALPVTLPEMADYKPTPDGRPPLARATDWVPTVDPSTGGPAERETNTMPQWAGSCWYYLRYIDPKNTERPFDPEKERYWMPVDLYIGGMEHAVLHLLYARFWHKVLFDIGVVSTKEPFKKLFNQGMILAYSYQDASGRYYHPEDVTERNGAYVSKDGSPLTSRVEKMSKSRLNVVNPDDVIARYGADALRLYEMFIGPLESSIPWQTNGIEGVYRFLKRSWRLFFEDETDALSSAIGDEAPDPNLERLLHRTVAKVTQDIDTLRFNTAISTLMELSNALLELPRRPRAALETFALLVSPFAPHFGEEAWRALGHPHSLAYHPWPSFDPRLLVDDDWELPVMVGGKVRGRVTVPRDLDAASIERLALALEPIQKLLAGAAPRRVVYVPGKMVNVVL